MLPQPLLVSDVKSFLELAGYYSKLIEGFAKIAVPLITVTRKEVNVALNWCHEHTKPFQQLKNAMVNALVLRRFDPVKLVIIECDACTHGVGAVQL